MRKTSAQEHGRDALATLTIRQGAYLPHWTKSGAIYAVTFRLGDSLPQVVLESWIFERENILKTARQLGRSLTDKDEQRLRQLHSEKVGKYLDAGHGACYMKNERIAKVVADALKYFDGKRYDLFAWCVMPNHVHVVVKPYPHQNLQDILHSWKSFTAHEALKVLGRAEKFWKDESYDRQFNNEVRRLGFKSLYGICSD